MRHLLLGFLVPSLAATGAAQKLLEPSTPASDRPFSEGVPSDRGERPSWLWRAVSEPAPQDPERRDYSPRGLFSQSHGAFLQRSRRYEPAIRGSYQMMPDAEVLSEPGSFDLERYRFDMTLPLAVDPDNVIYAGARFSARNYDFSPSAQANGGHDEVLYEAGLNLGWGSFAIDDNSYFEARFTPGIYSDWDDTLHREDLKWYGNALFITRVQEGLFLKFGIAYNETFEQVPVYPRLGLTWNISPAFRFDMLMPEYTEFAWTPSATWLLSAGVECSGDQYRTRTNGTSQKQQIQELSGYLQAVVRFNDQLSLFGKFGTTFAGDYDFRDGSGNRYNGTLDWNTFFEVGFGIDF